MVTDIERIEKVQQYCEGLERQLAEQKAEIETLKEDVQILEEKVSYIESDVNWLNQQAP